MALASSVSLYYSIVQRAARHYLEDYCHTGKKNYMFSFVFPDVFFAEYATASIISLFDKNRASSLYEKS